MKRHAAFLSTLAMTLLPGAMARADILLDTGPGPDNPIGYGVYGLNSPYGHGQFFQSLAGEFTIDQSWTITSVDGWLASATAEFNFPPGLVEISASIYSNVPANSAVYGGSGQPGTALLSSGFTFPFCTSAAQSSCPVGWQGPGGLSWNLNSGTYWVVFEGVGGDTGWIEMPGGVPSPLENSLFLTQGQDWSELYPGGFGVKISGTEHAVGVPTPGVLGLLAEGLVFLFAVRTWQRHRPMLGKRTGGSGFDRGHSTTRLAVRSQFNAISAVHLDQHSRSAEKRRPKAALSCTCPAL